MKKVITPIFVIVLLFFLPKVNFATHIVGGELNYRCLGNDLYEIEFTIFRDCFNGVPDFDYPASIGIFTYDAVADSFVLQTGITDTLILTPQVLADINFASLIQIGSSQIIPGFNAPDTLVTFGHLQVPFFTRDTLDPQLSNPCLVVPPDVCVNTTSYLDTVHLPFTPNGYTLAYQRCCRNNSILNIITPEDVGATYTVRLTETALNECNTNAKFNDWPPIYICVNEPIDFDHSASDIDGDSLVYRLCTPFEGATDTAPRPSPPNYPPYDTVVWVSPPYSNANIMGGVPLAIDSETGFMTGVPNTVGQFVVGVCVDEYRDGELISVTRRDFQYNVGVCGTLTAAFFVPEISCEGLEVNFENQSQASSSSIWYFNDPAFPDSTSILESPTFTYSDTGTYTVTLIAEPNSTTCSDTATSTFSIYYPSITNDFEVEVTNCLDPIEVTFTDLSTDTSANLVSWEWIVNNSIFGNLQTPPTYLANSSQTSLMVELIVTNELGCMDTSSQEIFIGLQLDYENIIQTCEVIPSTTLNVGLLSQPDIFDIIWQPQSAIISGQNTLTPTVDLQIDTVFYFTIEYDNNCIFEDSIIVINDNLDLMLNATADPDSIFENSTSQLEVTSIDSTTTYEWLPSNTLDNPNIFNPIASPTETTTYSVVGTNAQGCMDTTFVEVAIIEVLCEEPFLFMPNAFTPNGDNENDVLYVEGNTIDEMELAIYNRWGEKVFESFDQSIGWDGTYKGELLEPDTYGYYLKIRCFNQATFFKKGNISLIR